jgi:hypothetical protein
MINIEGLINFLTYYHYIGLLTLILASYFYLTRKVTFPLIIPFLFINCVVEIILVYYYSVKIRNSLVVYNYFNIIVILYYFYIYYNYFKPKSWSKYITYAAMFWSFYVIYIFTFENVFNKFHYHYLYGLLVIVILIFILLKNILESNEIIEIKKLPIFYFSLGILLFFFCALPLLVFSNTLLTGSLNNYKLLSQLIEYANIFLNLGYLGTVLWTGVNKQNM